MFKRFIGYIKDNLKNIGIGCLIIVVMSLIVVSAYSALSTGKTGDVVMDEISDEISNEYPPIEPTGSSDPIVFVNPVENGTIHKEYADDKLLEDKTSGYWQTHQAIDYTAPSGSKVYAVYDGTIESIKNDMMDGTVITLKISDDIKVVYKSLSEDVLVKEGDVVKSGDEIAVIGTNMIEKADGVHLHFEMYEKGELVNPSGYFGEDNK